MVCDAIITGAVSREIKRIQAERDLMRRRQSETMAAKIREAEAKYRIKPVGRMRRAVEQAVGLMVLLLQWRRENK